VNKKGSYFYINLYFSLGVMAVFGIRTRFDETNPSVKRLEVLKI